MSKCDDRLTEKLGTTAKDIMQDLLEADLSESEYEKYHGKLIRMAMSVRRHTLNQVRYQLADIKDTIDRLYEQTYEDR